MKGSLLADNSYDPFQSFGSTHTIEKSWMINLSRAARKRVGRGSVYEVEPESQWDEASRVAELSKSHDFLLAFVNAKLPSQLRRHLGASDIVQSVLFIVNRRHATFRGDSEEAFRAWILQIARHKIIDGIRRFRSRSYRPSAVVATPQSAAIDEETPSVCFSLAEDARAVICAVNDLPSVVREIVTLRYSQNLTFEQISAHLHLPVSTCRRHWLKGCEDLKKRLGNLLP